MRATAWLVCAALLWRGVPVAAACDPSIEELEDAVRERTADARAWRELVRTYRHYNVGKPVTEWALHTALDRHPGDPELLLQRIPLRGFHAAYPTLEELGRVPGWEARAKELAENFRFGVFPENGFLSDADFLGETPWECMLEDDRIPLALAHVEEGLRRKPGHRVLLARRALVLALLGRDEEAMKDQEASGWLQVQGGPWGGIGDVWLSRRSWALAFRSYGDAVPGLGRARMVYAVLLARRGYLDGAEKLLRPLDSERALVLLGLFLENGRFDRAVAIQEEVVDLVGMKMGSNYGESVGPRWGSLESPMTRAIRWLGARPVTGKEHFEADPHRLNWGVEADYPPEGREYLALRRRIQNRRPPTDEYIGILGRMGELMAIRGQHGWHARQSIGVALVEAGRWKAGLEVLAAESLRPRDQWDDPWDARIDTAVEWALAQAGRDAEILAAADPLGFIAVRRALTSINSVKEENLILQGEPAPPRDREIRDLVTKGRGVLAAVLAAYPRRTIGGGGNRPYLLSIVAQLGGPREVPFLLSEMRFHETWIGEAREPPWNAMAVSGASAIDRCLARVSGLAPEAPDRKTRREAWTAWWWAHAPEILGEK